MDWRVRFWTTVTVLGVVAAVAVSALAPVGGATGARAAARPGDELAACGMSGVDFVGQSEVLNKTEFGGFAVSELSGIAYARKRDSYYAIADRAGAVATHVFTLKVSLGGDGTVAPSVEDVIVLNDAAGVPFNGFNFDGEGIALVKGGDLFVASESGSAAGEQPEVRRFSRTGAHQTALAIPARFLIGPNNLSFESLSLSPNGHSLFTANEAPLAADGRMADLRSRIRILRFDSRGPGGFEPAQEYFYLTEPGRTAGDLGVAEIIALSETDILVLERGFVAGQGNTIRIFQVSLKHAADVSEAPSLAAPGLQPVSKTLLVDVSTCPSGGATIPPGATQPNALLDNFEAMTLGPKLPGGRRALILMSDDNGNAVQTTRLVVLAVPESHLNGQR